MSQRFCLSSFVHIETNGEDDKLLQDICREETRYSEMSMDVNDVNSEVIL